MWKHPFDYTLLNYSSNFIDVEFHSQGSLPWCLNVFYDFLDHEKRRDTLNLIRNLSLSNILPWCIIGNFNYLLSSNEKIGTRDHPNYLNQGFRDSYGPKAKETQCWRGKSWERALTNLDWHDMFPNFRFHNTIASKSDHSPVHLVLDSNHKTNFHNQFRFGSWNLPLMVLFMKDGVM